MQGEIQRHHGRILDSNHPDVTTHHINRCTATVAFNNGLTAVDHRLRVIDSNNPTVALTYTVAHSNCCCSQRAAKIVELSLFTGIAGSNQTDHGDDHAITRHRALYHIGEDSGDRLIKGKGSNLLLLLGENTISIAHGNCLLNSENDRCAQCVHKIYNWNREKKRHQ